MSLTKKEIAAIDADQAWWNEISRLVPGWTLYGWSFRSSASFHTGLRTTIQLQGHERDALVAALNHEPPTNPKEGK